MTQVTESEIIDHEGTACLLSKPETADGTTYPFGFYAVRPKEKAWSFRLCMSPDPSSLTNETLTQLLRSSRRPLRADWEEQVGHVVGWLTLYVPPPGGGSGAKGHRVHYEQGPEIELTPPRITPEPPQVQVPPLPEPQMRPDIAPPRRKPEPIDLEMF